ncbi:hypothetical protein GW17_00035636 [Ensete ventricosum]|nr:hypothetical protein GW17_00035636 [Ensete ventricosum]
MVAKMIVSQRMRLFQLVQEAKLISISHNVCSPFYLTFVLLWPYRSRVPQIASNSSQRRSGNVLPPPDEFSNSITASARTYIKSASNVNPNY